MFFVANRTREVVLHPSFFDSAAEQKIIAKLYDDMQGNIEGTEIVIQIIGVDQISEPVLVPGTGMAKYVLSYRAIIWRPFRGEVVDGLVTTVVSNGFFVEVGALTVFVSRSMIPSNLKYTVEGSTPSFTDNNDQIERGTQIRLRLKGIRGEIGSMFAVGSIAEDYLGALLQ
ncbi:DNA-directed RNA polymerase II subunit rpb7 [Pseudocercospora fuligena]|uniref:DNA-directed RNA polymerase subunit n=1 Tax=Pseudocercospora fuligena TaxID=685502 RepID=A0A8H6R7W9_9PEZI|nr:DNA-directed RNA polymerase II subunit rpb7 [Pseudocercospora fuligena]